MLGGDDLFTFFTDRDSIRLSMCAEILPNALELMRVFVGVVLSRLPQVNCQLGMFRCFLSVLLLFVASRFFSPS